MLEKEEEPLGSQSRTSAKADIRTTPPYFAFPPVAADGGAVTLTVGTGALAAGTAIGTGAPAAGTAVGTGALAAGTTVGAAIETALSSPPLFR